MDIPEDLCQDIIAEADAKERKILLEYADKMRKVAWEMEDRLRDHHFYYTEICEARRRGFRESRMEFAQKAVQNGVNPEKIIELYDFNFEEAAQLKRVTEPETNPEINSAS